MLAYKEKAPIWLDRNLVQFQGSISSRGSILALDLHGKHVLALNQPARGSARYALLVIDCRHMSKGKKHGEQAAQIEDPPEASSSGFVWIEPLLNKTKESILAATDSAIATTGLEGVFVI